MTSIVFTCQMEIDMAKAKIDAVRRLAVKLCRADRKDPSEYETIPGGARPIFHNYMDAARTQLESDNTPPASGGDDADA